MSPVTAVLSRRQVLTSIVLACVEYRIDDDDDDDDGQ